MIMCIAIAMHIIIGIISFLSVILDKFLFAYFETKKHHLKLLSSDDLG